MRRFRWVVSLSLAAFAACLCDSCSKNALAGGDGNEVSLGGLKSKAPKGWVAGKADNKFRAYQFRLPKAEGDPKDAELVVFFFGEGSGGGIADNVRRWQGMFDPPEGKTIEDASKVEKFKVGDVPVTYLEVSGTYKEKFPPFDPNAKITRRPEYRLVGVVFSNENGPYFIRLTGPERTVAQHKKAFDNWLKAFK